MAQPTPAELRAQSRIYVQAAREETVPELKQKFARYAFELAQLAEHIERNRIVATELDEHHRQLLEDSNKLLQTGLSRRA